MFRKITISVITILFVQSNMFAQTTFTLRGQADSLYKARQFSLAGPAYRYQAMVSDFRKQGASSLYNAACCYALSGQPDSAFTLLRQSFELGYSDKENLLKDADLETLHADKRWQQLIKRLAVAKKQINKDPYKTSFHTEDIDNFWVAYDKAQADTAQQVAIYRKYYFDKASKGMEDYMILKVESVQYFTKHYQGHPLFYKAIRKNTLQVAAMKPLFYKAFGKFKDLYAGAVFPDVYFIMGAFTSGGTVSDNGLLIGINQAAKSDDTPLEELSLRQKSMLTRVNGLPGLLAHELIHFQQGPMKTDTTTLSYAIREGMADFLGELSSGTRGNDHIHVWAKGKEKEIWSRFKTDMYLNRYDNWIANGKQETADFPADQGYWVGYQICKAYYDQATDHKKSIYDMLHIQDYAAFLKQSGWEAILNATF